MYRRWIHISSLFNSPLFTVKPIPSWILRRCCENEIVICLRCYFAPRWANWSAPRRVSERASLSLSLRRRSPSAALVPHRARCFIKNDLIFAARRAQEEKAHPKIEWRSLQLGAKIHYVCPVLSYNKLINSGQIELLKNVFAHAALKCRCDLLKWKND